MEIMDKETSGADYFLYIKYIQKPPKPSETSVSIQCSSSIQTQGRIWRLHYILKLNLGFAGNVSFKPIDAINLGNLIRPLSTKNAASH